MPSELIVDVTMINKDGPYDRRGRFLVNELKQGAMIMAKTRRPSLVNDVTGKKTATNKMSPDQRKMLSAGGKIFEIEGNMFHVKQVKPTAWSGRELDD